MHNTLVSSAMSERASKIRGTVCMERYFKSDQGLLSCQSFHRAVPEHRLIALCEGGFRFERPKAELRCHEQGEHAVKCSETDASSFMIISSAGFLLSTEFLVKEHLVSGSSFRTR